MEFPWVVWPSLWHSIRNWIFANLLIHRYLDQEFEMTSFKKGAIQALVYVSQELSKGNFESLEGTTHERIFVEITMCYHIFRGFQEYVNSPSASEGGLRAVYDNHERISIANYRFIREFTKGVVDDWTISLANHFKPGEHLQQASFS
ncbi:hypothetical protein E2C01_029690 [Portunus trituberculatus]|uniref:Uncharacterized protein n=1 Tax=Portunus trituberculatus TaxID=210409 RepID=A0A5B7ENL1_PORTR|nr:hypothetical protein [Portunus trituberculatus]